MSAKKFGIIIILILAMAIGAFWYMKNRPVMQKIINAPSTVKQDAKKSVLRADSDAWNKAIQSTYSVDKDFDGLTDVEEKALGTDPNSRDTDKDGYSDEAEVNIYKTNPKIKN